MTTQINEIVQITEYPIVAEMVKKIQESHGVYVVDGDHRQFVALPIEDFERLERQQKRLMLREQYLRMLINAGYTTEKLQTLLLELDTADAAWLDDPELERDRLFQFTENSFRRYCADQGVDYDSLSDESFSGVVDTLIHAAREEAHAAANRW